MSGYAEYLIESRKVMWNEDYMRFLVERVWKIEKPVNIIDFGCGVGFLGAALLPMLPEGCAYTGIDVEKAHLDEARKYFTDKKYTAEFVEYDLHEYEPVKKYGVAICQAVLMHVPNAKSVLKKMRDSVIPGGLVICIECDRNMANASMFFDGIDYRKTINLGILQKIWLNDFDRTGSDYNIALKIPVYMRELGLKYVGVRTNDCVSFIDPDGGADEYEKQYNAFVSGGWGAEDASESEKVASLIERGLTEDEAKYQFLCEEITNKYVRENKKSARIVSAHNLIISFGTV